MDNKNNNQKSSWIYIGGALLIFAFLIFAFLIFVLFAFYMEQHGHSSFLSNILQFIGITVSLLGTIVSFIGTIVSFVGIIVSIRLAKPSSSSNQCNVQDKDSNEKQNDEAKKTVQNNWWKRNRRRIFISLAIIFAIIFVASFCYNLHDYRKQQKELLLQQHYDALVDKYKKRINQELKFEDAYELLVDDSIMLMQIIQMLDENPNLKVDTTYYSKQFENRAGRALENINYAIFVLGLSHDDSLKYTKQKKDIERMIINIKKM